MEFVRALRPIGMPPSKKVGKAYKRMRARGFAAKDAIGEVKKRQLEPKTLEPCWEKVI